MELRSRRILIFCCLGAFFTLLLGSLGHFVYSWSGGAEWAAWLFPVNESVWEHLKLYILPITLYFALGAYFLRGANNYIAALFFCLALSAGVVTGGFYFYTSVVRHSILAVDILLFVSGTAAGWTAAYFLLNAQNSPLLALFALAGVIMILVCFFTFTFSPPHTLLFRTPDGTFGIPAA